MVGVKTFKDLAVWERSHQLALIVYRETANFPKNEEFGLKSQLRRAAVSIPSNIAEGFKRNTKKDSCHFYNMAQGSLEEVKYQIFLAKDLGYFDDLSYNKLAELSDEVGKILNGWIKVQK